MSLPLTCASLAPYASQSRNFQCQCRSTKPYVGNECPDCRCRPPKVFGPIHSYSVSFTVKAGSPADALHALLNTLRDHSGDHQQELTDLFADGLEDVAILEIDEYGRDERVS